MSNEGHDSVVGRREGFFSLKLEIPSVFDFQNFNRVPVSVHCRLFHVVASDHRTSGDRHTVVSFLVEEFR